MTKVKSYLKHQLGKLVVVKSHERLPVPSGLTTQSKIGLAKRAGDRARKIQAVRLAAIAKRPKRSY